MFLEDQRKLNTLLIVLVTQNVPVQVITILSAVKKPLQHIIPRVTPDVHQRLL